MFNIALAASFLIALLFSPGRTILGSLVGAPVLNNMPAPEGYLLMALTDYLIPATLIYLLLRLTSAHRWLRPHPVIHALLGIGNALLILCAAMLAAASTVQGGGMSLIAALFLSPLLLYPGSALLVIGLIWLAIRSFRMRRNAPAPKPPGAAQTIGVTIVFAMAVAASAWMLFLSNDAPLQLAAQASFQQRCAGAGEKIYERPQNVEGVYFDFDYDRNFGNIKNGSYGSEGASAFMAALILDKGYLLYYEEKPDPDLPSQPTGKYQRHLLTTPGSIPEEALTSAYGVFAKPLVSDEEAEKSGIHGTEILIKNLKTGNTAASMTYFINSRALAICGPAGDGDFSVSAFIKKALNLTPRFLNTAPQSAEEKK